MNHRWATVAAADIASGLADRAVACRGGAATWLAPRGEASENGAAPAALGPHVYDGTSGVALFLAAYHHVTGETEARDLALRAVAPLRAKMSQLAASPQRSRELSLAIGGLVGLGSYLYAFVRLAGWLREPELFNSARDVAALITPERIREDDRFDVMGGCAGTLLALLALERETSAACSDDVGLLGLARACGQHLLARRVAYRSLPRAWPGISRPPLSGFAHGAAGVACALGRLYQRTQDEELREAALEGFAYERSLFDPQARGWLDPRYDRLVEQSAWCHGAPGMVLGRLGSLAAVDTPAVRLDLEEALSILLSLPDCPVDYVCCGNLGRVDILLTAGGVLDRSALGEAAWQLAARVLTRAEESGFALAPPDERRVGGGEPEFGPSFFLGVAGIGYTLLRLAYPNRLPCVLLLE